MKSEAPFAARHTIRQAVLKLVAGGIRLLHERTILVLTIMFCAGVVCVLWYVSRLQSRLIASIALQDASLYSQALSEFRTLYTSEVVEAVRGHGIEVTHDYATKEGAIPLPATLSMRLGKNIGAHESGAQPRLYSAYPFPWRREQGGLQDAFAKDAWNALRQNPDKPFYRFEDFQGRRSLRYATADLMRPSCVNCHNTHPDSPKTNWQTGDMRGVLEVILPLQAAVTQTRMGLHGTFALVAIMSALGLSALAMVIGRLRRSSADLEQHTRELESEITVRQRTEAALRESEEKYRHIINTAADAIISIDTQGLVCEFNRAAEQMFGFSKADLLGKPLTPIMPEPIRDRHVAALQRYLTTGQRQLPSWQNIEFLGRTKAGREFPVEISFSLVEAGEKTLFTGVLRDITERKRAEAELRQAKETAEAASRAKSAFLANMSHELRTPLNAIIGFSEVLLDKMFGELNAKQEEYLNDICTSGTHLLSLINDILDLSEIEAGKLELELSVLDLRQILEGSLVMIKERALAHGIALSLELADDLDTVIGDERKVKQILFNLLSNAVKFTPDRGRVGIRALKAGAVVQTAVWDTGIGIAAADQERIFEAFQQVGQGLAGKTEGAGLGLALTRQLVELHGGAIWVESRPDRGSIFTFTLPLAAAASHPSSVLKSPR